MAEANEGDTVQIHYTGRLEDGTVFDSSEGRDPLTFKLGDGDVIPGFESAVKGMEKGESKTTEIPADEAYGPRRDDLVLNVGRQEIPEGLDPEVGQHLEMQTQDGQKVPVLVTDVDEEKVELDANHPLAGKDLTFEIELVDVG